VTDANRKTAIEMEELRNHSISVRCSCHGNQQVKSMYSIAPQQHRQLKTESQANEKQYFA